MRAPERLCQVRWSWVHLVLPVTACAALAAPAFTGAALIGPPDIKNNWNGSFGCLEVPCEYVNLSLPRAPASDTGFAFDIRAGKVRSPITGTITKWRVNVEKFVGTGQGPLQLQVLRRTVDEPGRAADEFRAIRQSSEEDTVFDVNTFFTSLRIRKGDFVGLNILGEDTSIRELDAGVLGYFASPLTPGGLAAPFDDFFQDRQILLNATVKD